MRWELLRRLVETPAPSGVEGALADLVAREALERGLEVKKDALSNVVVNPGAEWGFSAHMDEVSFIASRGHAIPRGTVPDYYVPAGVLQTLDGELVPYTFDEPKWEKTRLLADVPDGEVLVWKRRYEERGDLVVATGLDNKVGVFLLLTLLDELPENVGVAFTVQEEGGSHGARALSSWLKWRAVVVVDTAPTNWKVDRGYYTFPQLGSGPHVLGLGGGSYPNPELYEKLRRLVGNVAVATFTGGEFRRFFETVPRASVELLVPIANMHGPAEVVSKKDIEKTLEALKGML